MDSRCVAQSKLCIPLGSSHQFALEFQDENGAPKDVTGKSAVITISEQLWAPADGKQYRVAVNRVKCGVV